MRIKIVIGMGLLLAGTAHAQQPQIELPPEQSQPQIQVAPEQQPKTALQRETPIENPLHGQATLGSSIGGYGELTLNAPLGDSPGNAIIDLRRVVLFFGHNFTEKLRFYSEVEIEHAVSSAADQGEVEVEQAFLDALLHQKLNLRGGLILVPVGIVNVYHEPPTFNGVDRPDVDLFIIPSTWREPGVGIFGELTNTLRYQFYVMNGLNANGFTAEATIREGHQEAQFAHAGDVAAVLRLDWEWKPGNVYGFSAYGGTSGNSLANQVGSVPVGLFELDSRWRHGGWTGRAEIAFLFIGDTAALNAALTPTPPMTNDALPIASTSIGGYGEIGYDLFRLLRPGSDQDLTLFGRADFVDTQLSVPSGYMARPALRRTTITGGLTYRPIPQIALKLDYRRHEFEEGSGYNEIASAITWMF
jgi:hypothetical protein